MAILLARAKDPYKDDDGDPGLWRKGEIVGVVENNHVFGAKETPESGNYYHIKVTDKTKAEADYFMAEWRHNPTTEQIAANGDNRTIRVTTTMVAAGGAHAFTEAGFTQMLADINAEYPTANATYSTHTTTTYEFTITAPVAARDEIIERVNQAVRDMQYRRRQWYVNAAGQSYLDANGRVVSGTAAQVAQYLRDGLLD